MSSQWASSQPETFGGSNSIWPAWAHIHAHAVGVDPAADGAQHARGLHDRRLGHPAAGSYRCGWRRIAASSGRTLRPEPTYMRSSARAVSRGGGVGMK